MTTLYRYQPAITSGPNGTDVRPTGPDGLDAAETITEIAELGGWRYVAVPEGVLPSVPEPITTWEAVALTDELRAQIKALSPHCQVARERFISAIRAKHALDDELYYARIATGVLLGTYTFQPGEQDLLVAYQGDVEAARTTLQARYAEFGL